MRRTGGVCAQTTGIITTITTTTTITTRGTATGWC